MPKDGKKKLKMLFASADPVEEDPVSWLEVKKAIEKAFATAFPADSFDPEFIDASPEELADRLQNNTYDIFHFAAMVTSMPKRRKAARSSRDCHLLAFQ